MNKEDLIKKLEQVELPQIQLEGHRDRLRMVLLASDDFKNRQRFSFLESVRAKGRCMLERITIGSPRRSLAWKVVLVSIFTLFILATAIFTVPALGPLKSGIFPEIGKKEFVGPQLSIDEKKKAMDILMADPRITEILSTGAVIEAVLPINVTMQKENSQTGEIEEMSETWAQAWITLGEKQWGAQVDLVRGQVVALTE